MIQTNPNPAVIAMLVLHAPFFVACVVGVVLATVRRAQLRGAFPFAFVGFAGTGVLYLTQPLIALLMPTFIPDASPSHLTQIMGFLGVIYALSLSASVACLVVAVVRRRDE